MKRCAHWRSRDPITLMSIPLTPPEILERVGAEHGISISAEKANPRPFPLRCGPEVLGLTIRGA